MEVLTDAAALLVALAAVAGSVGILSRLRFVKWVWRQIVVDPFGRWTHRITTDAAQQVIRTELHPNGGTSFRDHLDNQFRHMNDRIGLCETELQGIRHELKDTNDSTQS